MSVTTFSRSSISPYLRQPAIIDGLPEHLREVPDEREAWETWRYQVLAYRELTRRKAQSDPKERAVEMALCKRDSMYWLTMYCIIFEPRGLNGEPPRWMPWIPYAFQVRTARAMLASMETEELGRGDFVAEKSRDMGMSWLCCAVIDWYFLFSDAFVAGVVSRNADAVDKTFNPDSLFFKIRANLNLQPQVPSDLRLPNWMIPPKLNDDWVVNRAIQHPDKMCVIAGETTTELSGVGGRATVRMNDEAARFADFGATWANQGPVSNHRWAISSADNKSPAFKILADRGKSTWENPESDGPTTVRLDWWLHPYHDRAWYAREKARYADQPHEFAREYDIDYFAGEGDRVYPNFQRVELVHAPYDPTMSPLYCAIDPGISDPTAIIWIERDKVAGRYRVVEAFQGFGGESAEFVASVLVGIPVSGYGGYNYGQYPGLQAIMDWTGNLRRPIQYVGDPYGAVRGADGRRTFYQALREESDKLTNGNNVVTVHYNTKADEGDARTFMKRKKAVEMIWSRMDFHRAAGPNMVLTALQESRYPERRATYAYTTEILEPQHDEFSHLRSAFEYWAVHVELAEVVAQKQPGAPMRVNLAGKVVR